MSETAHTETAESTPDGAASGRRNPSTRYLDDAEEIARVFKALRDLRAEIQLRFEGDEAPCTARILDLQGTTFLLEDVHPREGLKPLRAGKPFALSGRAQGIYVNCAGNRVTKTDSERSLPFFHVALPQSILFQQRRRTDRHRLPMRVATNGASVALFRDTDTDQPMIGRVLDISAGGCRAEFDGPAEPPVDADEQISACAISIPNLLELNAKAAIRHFSYDAQNSKLTCGIELTEMHVTDRRRLEQFIQSLNKVTHQT